MSDDGYRFQLVISCQGVLLKLFKFSAFVLGFLLLLQGVSPVSASESVQSYAAAQLIQGQ
jgi:hypothetical protein